MQASSLLLVFFNSSRKKPNASFQERTQIEFNLWASIPHLIKATLLIVGIGYLSVVISQYLSVLVSKTELAQMVFVMLSIPLLWSVLIVAFMMSNRFFIYSTIASVGGLAAYWVWVG